MTSLDVMCSEKIEWRPGGFLNVFLTADATPWDSLRRTNLWRLRFGWRSWTSWSLGDILRGGDSSRRTTTAWRSWRRCWLRTSRRGRGREASALSVRPRWSVQSALRRYADQWDWLSAPRYICLSLWHHPHPHHVQGHIICDDCLAALQASENRNKDCVLCKMKYVGRPTVLEKLLGLTLWISIVLFSVHVQSSRHSREIVQ